MIRKSAGTVMLAVGVLAALAPLASPAHADPTLVGRWTFEPGQEQTDTTGNWDPLVLHGNASVSGGQLEVNRGADPSAPASGWANAQGYRGPSIRAKTLISWISLDDLDQRSGSAMTLDSNARDEFDGIVYGERVARRWMNGSSNFSRTQDVVSVDQTVSGQAIQMAISYRDVGADQVEITICRNGIQIGQYVDGPMAQWASVEAEAIFGARHTVGPDVAQGLDAHIQEARIYDAAMTCGEVGDIFGPPTLLGRWTFEPGQELTDTTGNWGPLVLTGNATVSGGQLSVDALSSGAVTGWASGRGYTGPAISEKTLISWVSLDDLDIRGGSALTLDSSSRDEFDGIVYGERVPKRWMSGSSFHSRTQDAELPDEIVSRQLIRMAISYKALAGDQVGITICRNGRQIGRYVDGPMAQWDPAEAEVVFGARHTAGAIPQGGLDAHIEEARIYDTAMTCGEVGDTPPVHALRVLKAGTGSGTVSTPLVGATTNFTGPAITFPQGITEGPDGDLWFSNTNESGQFGSIGRVTTDGVVYSFTDNAISGPQGITEGPDGAVWFTNYGNQTIGRITTGQGAGAVSNFTGNGISAPQGITEGPDGALWFTNSRNHTIGRITTEGDPAFPSPQPHRAVTNYTGNGIRAPQGITEGPDGALWFTNKGNNSIGRITTDGAVTNYTGNGISAPHGITEGPDGALWFTNYGNHTIGRITTGGAVTNYTGNGISYPQGITQGQAPDGALWFTNSGNNSIGRMEFIGVIECGDDCTETYDHGAKVTLTAEPRAGSAFAGWSGACTNETGTCTVTMTEAKSVTATFVLRSVTAGNGPGKGTCGTTSASDNEIVGTRGDDVIRGATGRDVICSLGGDDSIRGLGGDDLIYAGPGDDTVNAGAGNDNLHGGKGRDKINGAQGADKGRGGRGNDDLLGREGDDSLRGDEGDDHLIGGRGQDNCGGGPGSNSLFLCET